MKKILYLSSMISVFSFTLLASDTTIYSYLGLKSYHNSFKNDMKYGGIYASIIDEEHKFEFGYESLELISFDDYSEKQNDLTFIYNNSSYDDLLLKAGIHYILEDNTQIYITGFHYKLNDRFGLGIDTYISFYNKLEDAIKVWQTEPSIGYSFGNYNSDIGSFYLKMAYRNIKLKETNNEFLQTNYNSIHMNLTHYKETFTTNIHLWTGEQLYAVDDGGFLVYNFNEKYQSGISASLLQKINESLAFKMAVKYDKFQEKIFLSNTQIFINSLEKTHINTASKNMDPFNLQLHMGFSFSF